MRGHLHRGLGDQRLHVAQAVPEILDVQDIGERIVALGSAGALDSSLDKQGAFRRFVVERIVYRTVLKWPVASQRAQWAALSASELDWTMVMPPMLTNGAGRGRYRIDGEALPRGGSRIARADVADFMFQQLTSSEWARKGVYISW